MLVHIMAQEELKDGDGPIGLICAPTRELCQQIHTEVKRFGKCYNLKVCGDEFIQICLLTSGLFSSHFACVVFTIFYSTWVLFLRRKL